MIPYLILLTLTIPLTRFFTENLENNKYRIRLFLTVWFIAIVLVSGLRGDFTADSAAYQKMFYTFSQGGWSTFASSFNLKYHFDVTEIGYILLNYLVGLFTGNYIYFQVFIAVLTYFPILYLCRQSDDIGLSLCLFLSIGTYIEGLNTVRNILAACLFIFAIKYIIKGEFKKYLIIIFLASTIHLSVLVMIPCYFILRMRPTKLKVVMYIVLMLILVISMDYLAVLYNKFFLVAQNSEAALLLLHQRRANPINVIVPCLLVASAVFVFYRTSNNDELNDMKTRVLLNGTIIWGIIKFSMLFSEYTSRFASYFSPFVLLFIPMVISRFIGRQRISVSIAVYMLYGLFFMIVCKSYGSYYFYSV